MNYSEEMQVPAMQRGRIFDRIFIAGTYSAAWLVLIIVVSILIALGIGAMPAFKKFGFGFLNSREWNPVTENFGALVAIYGTLLTSGLALLLGLPVSFGIAFCITELCPVWLKRPVKIAIELLAAIPSIIYGMWGLFVFAPVFGDYVQPWMTEHFATVPGIGKLFDGPPMGIGVLTAGIILGIMIIPFISSVMCELFESVPKMLKESAYGMGSTTWEVFHKIILPYTKIGIVGSIMLGLGRALGETMAVTFVIGNSNTISSSLFMPGNTISSSLANEFTEADGELYTSSLLALGFILFMITFMVLAFARLLLLHFSRKEGTQS